MATCQTTDINADGLNQDTVCEIWQDITWTHTDGEPDKSDTLQTIYEIKQNNAARAQVCPE